MSATDSAAKTTNHTSSPFTASCGQLSAKRPNGWARRVHAVLGLISALNLLLLLCTGLLLQNAALLRLDEHSVSRRFLPSGYRPQDLGNGVRADIVVTDLHSGRIVGAAGVLLLDAITVAWLVMLATGLAMYVRKLRAEQSAQGQRSNREDADLDGGDS